MDIRVEVEYTSEETAKIVAAHHATMFGAAPDGYYWETRARYGGFMVEACKVREPEPEPETVGVAAPVPTPVDEQF